MSTEIYNMIVNWPAIASEMQQQVSNLDALLDFVVEHVGEADVIYRFKDVASILSWLCPEEPLWNHIVASEQYHVDASDRCNIDSSQYQPCNDTTIAHVLKPGTKITIPKPSASDIKFQDMESVQAYLSQGPAYQSTDDSEEVDVTTFDYTPIWNSIGNQYQIIEAPPPTPPSKSRKNTKILTEKQSNTVNINATAPKKVAMKADGLVESTYKCTECDKKYKQKSSLLRHSKSHLPKEPGAELDNKPTNKRTNKKTMNGTTTHAILPLNTAEPIST